MQTRATFGNGFWPKCRQHECSCMNWIETGINKLVSSTTQEASHNMKEKLMIEGLSSKSWNWMNYIYDASSVKLKVYQFTVRDLEMQNRTTSGYGIGSISRQNQLNRQRNKQSYILVEYHKKQSTIEHVDLLRA